MNDIDPRDILIAELKEEIRLLKAKVVFLMAKLNERDHPKDLLSSEIELDGESVTVGDLKDELKKYKARANLNSGNSSLPSSKDPPWNPGKRSLREVTGNSVGGPPGHPGYTIKPKSESDESIKLFPPKCMNCSRRESCESEGRFTQGQKRIVIDIKVQAWQTEFDQMQRTSCPHSCADGQDKGVFPDGVNAYVQYGSNLSALVSILDSHGAMSDSRIADVINGLFDLNMSAATVVSMCGKCAEKVQPALGYIKERLLESDCNCSDETAGRVLLEAADKDGKNDGKSDADCKEDKDVRKKSTNMWIHTFSNEDYTLLKMSRHRGYKGMYEIGVLVDYDGILVHDCLPSYWKCAHVEHAICNAHILRELNWVEENEPQHSWPALFRELLLEMKERKEQAISDGQSSLPKEYLDEVGRRYKEIMKIADTECPPPDEPLEKKRGRRPKGKERSLIERLAKYEEAACRFAHDFRVPFDNNIAERSFRNVKTKIKVSGCIRSPKGMQNYIDIMSFIDTARKHGVSAYQALIMAFKGDWGSAIGAATSATDSVDSSTS